MPIYVDLQPDPQFDESLVRYCVINFNRFAQALRFTNKRSYSDTFSLAGPWPQIVNVVVPYRCDVVVWGSLGFWGTVQGMLGYVMTWNNINLAIAWDFSFTEIGSGKTVEAVNIVRGVSKGTHQCSQRAITGGLGSDGNSRLRLEFIFYEL